MDKLPILPFLSSKQAELIQWWIWKILGSGAIKRHLWLNAHGDGMDMAKQTLLIFFFKITI